MLVDQVETHKKLVSSYLVKLHQMKAPMSVVNRFLDHVEQYVLWASELETYLEAPSETNLKISQTYLRAPERCGRA